MAGQSASWAAQNASVMVMVVVVCAVPQCANEAYYDVIAGKQPSKTSVKRGQLKSGPLSD